MDWFWTSVSILVLAVLLYGGHRLFKFLHAERAARRLGITPESLGVWPDSDNFEQYEQLAARKVFRVVDAYNERVLELFRQVPNTGEITFYRASLEHRLDRTMLVRTETEHGSEYTPMLMLFNLTDGMEKWFAHDARLQASFREILQYSKALNRDIDRILNYK